MNINEILAPEAVLSNLKVTAKKQVLQELAAHAARLSGLDERRIFDTLLERERLGTTGVGRGIAIPHGKLADLDHVVGCFARLAKPIDFDAIDDEPVDLLFLLLAPEEAGAEHLKALACVSRLLRDQTVCKKIRGTDDGDAIFALLNEFSVSSAA